MSTNSITHETLGVNLDALHCYVGTQQKPNSKSRNLFILFPLCYVYTVKCKSRLYILLSLTCVYITERINIYFWLIALRVLTPTTFCKYLREEDTVWYREVVVSEDMFGIFMYSARIVPQWIRQTDSQITLLVFETIKWVRQ